MISSNTAPSDLPINSQGKVLVAKSRFSRAINRLNYFAGKFLYNSSRLPISVVLGRKQSLTLDDLREKRRRSIAKRIIEYFPEKTWSTKFEVYEDDNPKVFTPFELDCENVITEFNLSEVFTRLDSISLLGRYSCLLLGIGRPGEKVDLSTPLKPNPNNKLIYLRPLAEDNCQIKSLITDKSSPNWGMPEYYELIEKDDNENNSFISGLRTIFKLSTNNIPTPVHYSRIIHFVPIPFESEIYNDPPLLFPVYDYLEDLEKITGSSAEIFWRDAKKTKTFEAKDDYEIDTDVINNLEKQVEEVEQGLKSYMVLEGLQAKEISSPVNKLNGTIEPLFDLIFGTLGITKRGFLGSDTGERASVEDAKTDSKKIKLRQERIGIKLIRQLFDLLIKYQVIIPPKELNRISNKPVYKVEFIEKNDMSLIDKVTALDKLASANDKQSNIDGHGFTTSNEGRELILGLDPLELEDIDYVVTKSINSGNNNEDVEGNREDNLDV